MDVCINSFLMRSMYEITFYQRWNERPFFDLYELDS